MDDDQLVEDYLRRLGSAAESLPPGQRDALVTHTAGRIAEARADGPQRGTAMASVHVLTFLEQLGEPEDLVRPPKSRHRAGGSGSSRAAITSQEGTAGGHEVAAIILLLGGALLGGIGWLVGVILLWTSRRWRFTDKVLGTLVWPGGVVAALGAPAVLFYRQVQTGPVCATDTPGTLCPTVTSNLLPGWLFVLLLVVSALLAVGGPAWMAIRLMRRAREAGARAPAAGDRLPVESGA